MREIIAITIDGFMCDPVEGKPNRGLQARYKDEIVEFAFPVKRSERHIITVDFFLNGAFHQLLTNSWRNPKVKGANHK